MKVVDQYIVRYNESENFDKLSILMKTECGKWFINYSIYSLEYMMKEIDELLAVELLTKEINEMGTVKRKFICTGCGNERPCVLETNQEKSVIAFFDHTEELKCVLDPTNETSYNWREIQNVDRL